MVVHDRTDTGAAGGTQGVGDVVGVVDLAAVAQQDRGRDLLRQHEPHLALEPGDDVKVDDVQDVVPVHHLLLVDGGGGGGPLDQREVLLLLHVAGDVALGASLVLGDVRDDGPDPGERALPGRVEHVLDPRHVPAEEVRGVVQQLRVREQRVDALQTVSDDVLLQRDLHGTAPLGSLVEVPQVLLAELVVLDHGAARRVLLGLLEHVRHGAGSFLVVEGAVALGVGVRVVLVVLFVLVRVLSGTVGRLGSGDADHVVDDVLLLVGQGVVHVHDRLVVVLVLGVRAVAVTTAVAGGSGDGLGCGLGHRGSFDGVGERVLVDVEAVHDDDLAIAVLQLTVGVLDLDLVDHSAGVGTGEDQADLLDLAVHDRLALHDETVGVDRHRLDVLVLDVLSCVLPLLGVVEEPVGVDAVLTVLQDRVTQHVLRVVVAVVVHERHLRLVLVRERSGRDGLAVGALDVCLGGVAAEISFHFDCSLLVLGLVVAVAAPRMANRVVEVAACCC